MINKKNASSAGHWVEGENGSEKTRSHELIKNSLVKLMKNRGFVALLHRGYQSGNTIIVSFDSTHMLIDKPLDWPGSSPKVRVVFKDEAKVWNHFTVNVLGASKDTLKTSFPTELFRLQRRSHFRIEVPKGSNASFAKKDELFANAEIVNISAGGAMLSLNRKTFILGEHSKDNIEDLVLNILASGDEDQLEPIKVAKARIARESFDKASGRLLLGIEFYVQGIEEKQLLKYVRHRELEIMRKSLF